MAEVLRVAVDDGRYTIVQDHDGIVKLYHMDNIVSNAPYIHKTALLAFAHEIQAWRDAFPGVDPFRVLEARQMEGE